jgi:hypothetical protein
MRAARENTYPLAIRASSSWQMIPNGAMLHPLPWPGHDIGAASGRALEPPRRDGRDWWRAAFSSDAMILVEYYLPDLRSIIRLTLFALSDRPIICWWVGSDVWNCSRYPAVLEFAKYLDRFTAANVSVALTWSRNSHGWASRPPTYPRCSILCGMPRRGRQERAVITERKDT